MSSRRQFLAQLGVTVVSAAALPGCCTLRNLVGNPCDPLADWQAEAKPWWSSRSADRDIQRRAERKAGTRPDTDTPYAYLICGRHPGSLGDFGSLAWLAVLAAEELVQVVVTNAGNAPSFSCYVDCYESQFANYGMRFADMRLTGRETVTVQPGEHRQLMLPFTRTRDTNGSIVVRCYDPVQDPGLLAYEHYDRKNVGTGWTEWGGM